MFEQTPGRCVRPQERLDTLPQLAVVAASFIEIRSRRLRSCKFQSRHEDVGFVHRFDLDRLNMSHLVALYLTVRFSGTKRAKDS
jgi:hypothetical protein